MAKNDYRRALIMLRGLEKGYGGHARLEKRVMSGTMDFTVSAPAGETLAAALVGPRGGKTVGKALGTFKPDGRGQMGLLASFDPRNIAGLDLSEVSAAIIARISESGVTPLLYGWINGSKTVNWQEIQGVLESLFPISPPKAVESEPTPPEIPFVRSSPTESETPADEAAPQENESPANENAPQENESPASGQPEESAQETPELPADPLKEESVPISDAASPSAVKRAGQLLDLDMNRKWPDDIESLRILFLTLPPYQPFEMDGFVFVRAGMAEETGIDHCAVGIRAENGRVTGVCYAIPMTYTSEPPAGLEDYVWIGDHTRGWWVTVDDWTEQETP